MANQAFGTTLRLKTVGSTRSVLIEELTEINLPTITKEAIESVYFNSNAIKTYKGGIVDFGEISFTTLRYFGNDEINENFLPHSFNTLFINGTALEFVYKENGASSSKYGTCFITNIEHGFDNDDVRKQTITLKVNTLT
jgi:hypothetical protein